MELGIGLVTEGSENPVVDPVKYAEALALTKCNNGKFIGTSVEAMMANIVVGGGGNVDPTKDSFTQAEFLSVVRAGDADKMHVGALIYLDNEYCDTYEVIGVNHDNTNGTVDIMSHYSLHLMEFGSSPNYEKSSVREWLLTEYLSAFPSKVQNCMNTMRVVYYNAKGSSSSAKWIYLPDKVKLLSCTELSGISVSNYDFVSEGTAYEAFGTPVSWRTASPQRYRNHATVGSYYSIWTRTDSNNSGNYYKMFVKSSGQGDKGSCSSTRCILPVMRF